MDNTANGLRSDIKPENLLFYPCPFIPTRNPKPRSAEDEDKADEGEFVAGVGSGGIGKIKIADFGLSKVIWDSQTVRSSYRVSVSLPRDRFLARILLTLRTNIDDALRDCGLYRAGNRQGRTLFKKRGHVGAWLRPIHIALRFPALL